MEDAGLEDTGLDDEARELVVVIAIVDVMMLVERSGQFVTVEAQPGTTISVVV